MPSTKRRPRRRIERGDQPTAPPIPITDLLSVAETTPAERSSSAVRLDLWQTSALLIVLLGILLRWWQLNSHPLQPDEAGLAMRSWSIVMGKGNNIDYSPLLLHGNALLLFMFGASDVVVRILPALAGSVLILLPLWLRDYLGRTGALLAMLFLAISPTMVFTSRHNTPEMLTAAAGLTLVVCALAYLERRSATPVYIGAVALALLVASGYSAYTYIVAFGSYLAIRALAGRRRYVHQAGALRATSGFWTDSQAQPLGQLLPSRSLLARAGLLGAGVFIVVTTAALTSLRVIQAGLASPLANWLATFSASGLAGRGAQLATLSVYEGLLVVVAIAGIVYYLNRGAAFHGFLTWWMLVGLLVGVAGGTAQGGLLAVGLVPAALLAGAAGGDLLDRLQGRWQKLNLLLVALVLTVLAVATYVTTTYMSIPTNPEQIRAYAFYGFIAVVAILIIGFVASSVRFGLKVSLKSFAAVGLVLGLLLTFRANSLLNLRASANPNELFTPVATSPDIRSLVDDFGQVMDVLFLNRFEQSVQLDERYQELLMWYLRDYKSVNLVRQPEGAPAVFITDPAAKPPRGGAYAGQRYRIATMNQVRLGSLPEFWRWLLYRESPSTPAGRDVIVFVKTQAR